MDYDLKSVIKIRLEEEDILYLLRIMRLLMWQMYQAYLRYTPIGRYNSTPKFTQPLEVAKKEAFVKLESLVEGNDSELMSTMEEDNLSSKPSPFSSFLSESKDEAVFTDFVTFHTDATDTSSDSSGNKSSLLGNKSLE